MTGEHPLWTYNTHPVLGIGNMPEDSYGFIYEVTHIPTARKYIGKKVLFFERNKRLGKKSFSSFERREKSKRNERENTFKAEDSNRIGLENILRIS